MAMPLVVSSKINNWNSREIKVWFDVRGNYKTFKTFLEDELDFDSLGIALGFFQETSQRYTSAPGAGD